MEERKYGNRRIGVGRLTSVLSIFANNAITPDVGELLRVGPVQGGEEGAVGDAQGHARGKA